MSCAAVGQFQSFGFVGDHARVHEIAPRRSFPVHASDAAFLLTCARQAHGVPDYSHAMVMAPAYYTLPRDVELLGDSGAIAMDGRLIVESQLHLKKLARSSSYRQPRDYEPRSCEALASSIFYLPEAQANFYHWLIDCLPRLWMLSQATGDPVTIFCHAGMTGFQKASLEMIRGSFPDWSFETIGPAEKVTFLRYVFPSFLSGLNSGLLHPQAIDFLRRHLQPAGASPRGVERIYITRRLATQRRLAHEAQVWRALEREGFVCVELERLSLPEQIALFTDAKVIAGVHGAGLSNIVFATDARIVEIHPADFCRPHYLMLARSCGHEYRFAVGGRLTSDRDFDVDAGEVVRLACTA